MPTDTMHLLSDQAVGRRDVREVGSQVPVQPGTEIFEGESHTWQKTFELRRIPKTPKSMSFDTEPEEWSGRAQIRVLSPQSHSEKWVVL